MKTGLLLVTGASGFLGRSILAQALARGWTVRAFALDWPRTLDGVDCVTGDMADAPTVEAAMRGVTHVVHAAGLAHQFRPVPEGRYFRVNARGSETVARAAAANGVQRCVVVSSVSVYGGGDGLIDERRTPAPRDAYARSKLAGEQAVLAADAPGGPSVVALRLATLYGEGDPGNVVRLIRAIDRRRFLAVGPGTNRKSLLYRDDAALACIAAVEGADATRGIYNVSAPPVAMRDVVSCIADLLGRRQPPFAVPAGLARLAAACVTPVLRAAGRPVDVGAALAKWLNDDAYDGSRFDATFGRVAGRTPLADGLSREVAWYRSGAPAWA
jgi:UDP-glucose 4-epimerase